MKEKIIIGVLLILMIAVVNVSAAKEGINFDIPPITTAFVNLGTIPNDKVINFYLEIPEGFMAYIHIYIGENMGESIYDNNEFYGGEHISINTTIYAVYILTIYNTNAEVLMSVSGWFSVDDSSITTSITTTPITTTTGMNTTETGTGYIGTIDLNFLILCLCVVVVVIIFVLVLYRKFVYQVDYSYLLVPDLEEIE